MNWLASVRFYSVTKYEKTLELFRPQTCDIIVKVVKPVSFSNLQIIRLSLVKQGKSVSMDCESSVLKTSLISLFFRKRQLIIRLAVLVGSYVFFI